MKKISIWWGVAVKAVWMALCLAVVIGAGQVYAAPFGELISFWDDREERSGVTIDHSRWQGLLNTYLDDQTEDGINRFDYARVSLGDRSRLEAYIDYLQKVEPRQLNGNEQMAYWVNLYNATTVLLVLRADNISSIQQIRAGFFKRGPWQMKVLTILQRDLSLDDIEHGILRPIWRDNRIHYVVNCASLGCPNLLKTAFTGENIQALLDKAARDFINHPRGVSVEAGELTLSSIFDWYAEDFGDGFVALKEHLSRYAEPELASRLRAYSGAAYQYDWSLNRP